MKKQEFLSALAKRLSGLPKQETEERLYFYSEMIDDRIEEGRSEEEAVSEIGSVEEVAEQIIAETPLLKIVKENVKPKRRWAAWEILLLALGSPIWLSLAIAAFAVILSLYVVLWSVAVSLWGVFVSFAACAVGCTAGGVLLAVGGYVPSGMIVLAAGTVCAGLAIFTFFGCKAATKGLLILTKKITVRIKNCFIKKEEA